MTKGGRGRASVTRNVRPVYTDTPPTKPGLYWYRVGVSKVDRFCRVWKLPRFVGGDLLVAATDGGVKGVQLFERQWAGPLLEPRSK